MDSEALGTQEQQGEWHYQWSHFEDNESFLFRDWIAPNTLESFAGLRVFEGGCGSGHHTRLVAAHCEHTTAVDLNTSDLAQAVAAEHPNVRVLAGDVAAIRLKETFDVVFSVGVVHHTDDPDATVANLKRLVAPGGRLILWVYSREGNFLARNLVERPRRAVLRHLPRPAVHALAWAQTIAIHPVVHTVYRLPIPSLPYYQYMKNWRRLPFERNVVNVFDKLNAPQTQFISERRARSWADDADFELEHLSDYLGVSWRLTLRRRS